MGDLVFILGPARSGKSRLAERLGAERGPNVLYVATLEPLDDEMQQRIAGHRALRPQQWQTLEEPIEVVEKLSAAGNYDACILDCLTLWVSNLLLASAGDAAVTRKAVIGPVKRLIDWQASAASPLIVVSNEVGSGIVPEYALGRSYRDLLGEANQLMATAAARFYHAFAGHYLDMKALGARPVDIPGPSPHDPSASLGRRDDEGRV
jgi:adenosylcobinamide kinase/adenosylcobinamide-phosphate guanylyltransferase